MCQSSMNAHSMVVNIREAIRVNNYMWAYAEVLRLVKCSMKAEQYFCSIVTQMTYLPQFKHQQPLDIVHKENYETSYHRNTAIGNLRRLLDGDMDELVILMTVECIIEAARHDAKAKAALAELSAGDEEGQMWLGRAEKWQGYRSNYLARARSMLRGVIGPQSWAKGKALAQ